MANTIRIKRRASGAAGAPASLQNAELAFNEVDDVLYYGKGVGGTGGTATTVEAIGGKGAVVMLSGDQTVAGKKTFSGEVLVPAPTADSHAVTKKYADALVPNIASGSGISVTEGTSDVTIAADSTIARVASPTFTGSPKVPSKTNALSSLTTAGDELLIASLNDVDAMLRGRLAKVLSGNTSVELTAQESAYVYLDFTGTLTGGVSITLKEPISRPRTWVVSNRTTGGYSLTITGSAPLGGDAYPGGSPIVPHNTTQILAYVPGVGLMAITTNSAHTTDGSAHQLASTTVAGFMSTSDKTKLNGIASDAAAVATTDTPGMNGTAALGTAATAARSDHIHPTDTSRAPLASPALTGTPTAPTAATATSGTQIATTAFVHNAVAADNAASATKLKTSRSISASGDATWTVDFDGSANATAALTLAASGVTAGTHTKVTVDTKGRVTSGTTLAATDIPSLTAEKISDFTTEVRKSALNQMAVPTADVNFNSKKITGLAEPSAASDAATKNYVDLAVQGLDPKQSVRAATTGNITLSGTQTVNGVALAVGDRVLVKDQTASKDNGIYLVAAAAWTRAPDANTWDKLVSAYVFSEEGANKDVGYYCTVDKNGTLGSTAVSFVQFTGAAQIAVDGFGLQKYGNVLSLAQPLSEIAGLTPTVNSFPYYQDDGANMGVYMGGLATLTEFGRSLLDDANAAAGRATLGLGTIATQASNNVSITGGSIDSITFDGGTF